MSYETIRRIMKVKAPAGSNWESKAMDVLKFKKRYKRFLRTAQKGLCCYCLRPLGDDGDVDLEHILEKNVVTIFSFNQKNLALSCGRCNTNKEATRKKINNFLLRRIRKKFLVPTNETIETGIATWLMTPYVSFLEIDNQRYRMFHPHFHKYSDHIEYIPGFIYRYKTKLGRRTGRALWLNELAEIEKRRISEKGGLYNTLKSAIGNGTAISKLSDKEKLDLIKLLSTN